MEYQKTHRNLRDADGYTVQESWLAKLGQWNEALLRYDQRLEKSPNDGTAILGKLKCLDALGRWDEAILLCMQNLDDLKKSSVVDKKGMSLVQKTAVIGAR